MTVSDATPINAACSMLELTTVGLWFDYLSLGGNLAPDHLGEFLRGDRSVSDHDYDLVVHALNERFWDHGDTYPVLYADELPTAE